MVHNKEMVDGFIDGCEIQKSSRQTNHSPYRKKISASFQVSIRYLLLTLLWYKNGPRIRDTPGPGVSYFYHQFRLKNLPVLLKNYTASFADALRYESIASDDHIILDHGLPAKDGCVRIDRNIVADRRMSLTALYGLSALCG